MPRVKIDTPGVSVELDANEASVDDLRKQAMDTFKEANQVMHGQPTHVGFGAAAEKRWTPDHQDVSGGGYGRNGFEPVHAGGEQ